MALKINQSLDYSMKHILFSRISIMKELLLEWFPQLNQQIYLLYFSSSSTIYFYTLTFTVLQNLDAALIFFVTIIT